MSADPPRPRPQSTGSNAVVPLGDGASRSTSTGKRRATRAKRRTAPVQTLPVPRREKSPTILGMVVGPLLATAGVVALAAVHTALGSPLGPKWGADLWEMVRSVLGLWVLYGPFTVYVQRRNAAAAIGDGSGGDDGALGRHSPRALGEEGEDDGDDAGRSRRATRDRP